MGRISTFVCCALSVVGSAGVSSSSAAESKSPISVSWRLVGNRPDSHYDSELTLRNDGSEPLPAHWNLYFNSDRRLSQEKSTEAVALEHVNGDLYRLRPNADASPLGAGAEIVVRMSGAPWAINVSDAPSGLYLVTSDAAGKEQPAVSVPVQIGPFPDSKLIVRGGDDRLPIVTAAARFAANEKLELMSPDKLPKVIPTPLRTTPLAGQVKIDGDTTIVYDPKLSREAQFLADWLQPLLNVAVATSGNDVSNHNVIRLRLHAPSNSGSTLTRDESYSLSARPDAGIEIVGNSPSGVFYGIQTLRALLPIAAYREPTKELSVEAVEIYDGPRFGYRGLMLDVGRNFQSPETVRKLLDLMAFYKLNRFHWHLSDDEGWRIEIKALPELTAIGGRRGHTTDDSDRLIPSLGSGPGSEMIGSGGSGFYSQDEFIEILKYAAERHIDVIPELDVPGHSRAAVIAMKARAQRLMEAGTGDSADEFLLTDPDDKSKYESVQMWRDNVMDVGRDSTYRFLDVVFGELASMYERAGVPLKTIHLGGDEVPEGAWLASPACEKISDEKLPGLSRGQQLQLRFLDRACDLVAKRGIQPACWEDCLLFGRKGGALAAETRAGDQKPKPTVYVWNNVWGWGREDCAYRLANAGYDVVLANATNLYFDLAQEKEPNESGYYWAGFVGIREPFEFNPLNLYQNATSDSTGHVIPADRYRDSARLSEDGKRHILGIQGELWAENLRSPQRLEYMAFPRTIALAERAWAAAPAWADANDAKDRDEQLALDWNRFANALGQRELPRLDYLDGGVEYRIPPPGASASDGSIRANVEYPGLEIRYTTDGSDPTPASTQYRYPIRSGGEVRLRTFDSRGRGSRPSTIGPPNLN